MQVQAVEVRCYKAHVKTQQLSSYAKLAGLQQCCDKKTASSHLRPLVPVKDGTPEVCSLLEAASNPMLGPQQQAISPQDNEGASCHSLSLASSGIVIPDLAFDVMLVIPLDNIGLSPDTKRWMYINSWLARVDYGQPYMHVA